MAERLTLRQGRRVALLAAGVLLGHWLVLDSIGNHLAAQAIDATMAPRLRAVYVRQLALADPPRIAAVTAPAVAHKPASRQAGRPTAATPVQPAASEPGFERPPPEMTESVSPESAADPPAAIEPPDPAQQAPLSVAVADASEQADAALATADDDTAPPFSWPASTRLNYVLTGNYRGEVHGSAQVEWINSQPRYQVNLDVTIGLPIAPLLTRQMRSDGVLGPAGLQPLRYDQRSKMAFQEPRVSSLRFQDSQVGTVEGRLLPMPAAGSVFATAGDFEMSVQDSASQFVQLTWLFTTQPRLLAPGTTISFPLALPGRVADWRYQVGQAQTLQTSFGAIEAYRVHTAPGTDRRRDLLAEAWFAPQLAYLPVRIRIEQDADVYLDLMIKEKPELSGR